MSKTRSNLTRLIAFAVGLSLVPTFALAQGKVTKIRIQSVIPTSADEVIMLKEFASDIQVHVND